MDPSLDYDDQQQQQQQDRQNHLYPTYYTMQRQPNTYLDVSSPYLSDYFKHNNQFKHHPGMIFSNSPAPYQSELSKYSYHFMQPISSFRRDIISQGESTAGSQMPHQKSGISNFADNTINFNKNVCCAPPYFHDFSPLQQRYSFNLPDHKTIEHDEYSARKKTQPSAELDANDQQQIDSFSPTKKNNLNVLDRITSQHSSILPKRIQNAQIQQKLNNDHTLELESSRSGSFKDKDRVIAPQKTNQINEHANHRQYLHHQQSSPVDLHSRNKAQSISQSSSDFIKSSSSTSAFLDPLQVEREKQEPKGICESATRKPNNSHERCICTPQEHRRYQICHCDHKVKQPKSFSEFSYPSILNMEELQQVPKQKLQNVRNSCQNDIRKNPYSEDRDNYLSRKEIGDCQSKQGNTNERQTQSSAVFSSESKQFLRQSGLSSSASIQQPPLKSTRNTANSLEKVLRQEEPKTNKNNPIEASYQLPIKQIQQHSEELWNLKTPVALLSERSRHVWPIAQNQDISAMELEEQVQQLFKAKAVQLDGFQDTQETKVGEKLEEQPEHSSSDYGITRQSGSDPLDQLTEFFIRNMTPPSLKSNYTTHSKHPITKQSSFFSLIDFEQFENAQDQLELFHLKLEEAQYISELYCRIGERVKMISVEIKHQLHASIISEQQIEQRRREESLRLVTSILQKSIHKFTKKRHQKRERKEKVNGQVKRKTMSERRIDE